jgi:predicted nucleotidyltransferase
MLHFLEKGGVPLQTVRARRYDDEDLCKAVEILKAYGAKRVILFGSAARGAVPQDLDLACEGLPSSRFFEALGKLLTTLSVPVDLVDLQGKGLRASIRERIAREGVLLYEAD